MVNQTEQLKSVFGDALGSPMGFLNPDSNSQPIMSPRIQENVATPVKPLEKEEEISDYIEKVNQKRPKDRFIKAWTKLRWK